MTVVGNPLLVSLSLVALARYDDSFAATRYCSPAAVNSSSEPGALNAVGSNVVLDNDLTSTAYRLPPSVFGYFLTSQTQGLVAMPRGSQGNLCLGGDIGRYFDPGQVLDSGAAGFFSLALDLSMTPAPTGLVQVLPGETWSFQAWFRDSAPASATSNFTDALRIAFH